MNKIITYILAIVAIAAIASTAYTYSHYSAKIGDLESTINTQTNQIEAYQQLIDEQTIEIDKQQQISQQITLVDDYGYVLNITSYPERIVSLAPSNTELLFAVGAGNNVVGITDYCNYPYNFTAWTEAGNITSIGDYWQPAIEPIISLEPDLVLASGDASSEVATKLRNLGYNALIIEATDINGVLRDIFLVGQATNNTENAQALVNSLHERIDTVTETIAEANATKLKVYDEIWHDPLMAAGPGTFISDLISLAGGENIFDDTPTDWPIVSSDSVISKNPDIILSQNTEVASRAGWSSINAVKNNQIYQIDEDIFSRPGPRLIDALEVLSEIIHPELFGNP
ncbi:MAG: cobalamin-binding protein [Candidatus Bathyarchaeota archaeon]|nr:cobalamin-binding protein [Candidatus Bathyarchaeota archaeon]